MIYFPLLVFMLFLLVAAVILGAGAFALGSLVVLALREWRR